MKKTIATLAIIGILALTGCATGNPDASTGESTHLHEQHIKLNDERTVVCVTYKNGYAGGLSCDWMAAK